MRSQHTLNTKPSLLCINLKETLNTFLKSNMQIKQCNSALVVTAFKFTGRTKYKLIQLWRPLLTICEKTLEKSKWSLIIIFYIISVVIKQLSSTSDSDRKSKHVNQVNSIPQRHIILLSPTITIDSSLRNIQSTAEVSLSLVPNPQHANSWP